MDKKIIVISAVNLVEAGTLAILKECLAYLSNLAENGQYRVVAIVYDKSLAEYPNIEYIETKWPKKRWINRLWYEYVSMNDISKSLGDVYLWFSLHDTTPTVKAHIRAVYCHNSYSFYKWKLHDLIFAPKIALFAIFTKFIYRTNIYQNKYLVVQQQWFREGLSNMFNIPQSKIIVAKPESKLDADVINLPNMNDTYSFIFAGSPNSHKNFEIICQATEILEKKHQITNFKIHLTLQGNENKYASWIKKNWGHLITINFMGFIPKDVLLDYYSRVQCLIYPSKVESWGLPISEFARYNKPMLLANLPYAHETAEGAQAVSFFDPLDADQLAEQMRQLIQGNTHILAPIEKRNLATPIAKNWEELFRILLK